jgi:gliding motility-associated transport system permease protein
MISLKIAWQDFKVSLKSPSFYFVGALFLFYQGIVFSVTVALRHHPLSPPGPLLAPFFGGPFWFWPLLILVVVELSHGAISRERQRGTLSFLLSSSASPGQVVFGKFLSVFFAYSLLWFLTLPLVLLLFLYIPSSVHIQLMPLITGYIGALMVGAAGLALGIFFSSVTQDTRLSGMLTFVVLFLLVLLKILIHPSFGIISSPKLISIAEFINFLDFVSSFAMGTVKGVQVIVLGGMTLLSLKGASLIIGKEQRKHRLWGIFDLFIWIVIIVTLTVVLNWRKSSWDPGFDKDIDTRLVERIDMVKEPVNIYLFTSPPSSNLHFHPLPQLEAHLDNICKSTPFISWHRLTVSRPGYFERKLAAKFKLNLERIQADSSGLVEGVLVVESGNRHRIIPISSIFTAKFSKDKIMFSGIRLEAELAGALAFLEDPTGLLICIGSGHGEKDITDHGPQGFSKLLLSMKSTGWNIKILSPLVSPIPSKCKTVFLPAPTEPFLPNEIEALESYLMLGGGLVVTLAENGMVPRRLSQLLKRWHLNPTDITLFDKGNSVGKSKGYYWAAKVGGQLKTRNWRLLLEGPREIKTGPLAKVLIQSSSMVRRLGVHLGRGKMGIVDSKTPRGVISACNGEKIPGRLVVTGFTIPFTNRNLDSKGYGRDSSVDYILFLFEWSSNKSSSILIPPKKMVHHHLSFKSKYIDSIHLFSLLILPLLIICIGLWVAWRRRK